MAVYRNVWALIAAVGFLQIGGGILGILTPLGLDAIGAGELTIGAVAALHAAGYMIGARFSTWMIRTFGNIRVYSAAAAVAAVTVLMMQITLNVYAWSAIRLLQGMAFVLMFSSAESWLGSDTPREKRGSVTGLYHVVAKAALITGPFFVAGLAATDYHPYTWAAIFLAMSLLPICLTQKGQPEPPDTSPLSLKRLFELAPAAVVACFLAGIINTGTLSLLPLYAEKTLVGLGDGATGAAAWAAAGVWGGALLSQWPAGRLSDKADRRLIIAILAASSTVAALLLGFGGNFPVAVTMALLTVWGAGSLSYYGIAVAHAIDRAPDGQIAQVMAGLLFVWAFGSVFGPLLSGGAMRMGLGAGALFLLAATMGVFLTAAMLVRKVARKRDKADTQTPWNPAMPTLATSGEVDPRTN